MRFLHQRESISMPAAGARVVILSGRFKGDEGICLGEDTQGHCAVSADRSDEILSLVPDRDFALLVDLSADPLRN
jgi:hypothetical protein